VSRSASRTAASGLPRGLLAGWLLVALIALGAPLGLLVGVDGAWAQDPADDEGAGDDVLEAEEGQDEVSLEDIDELLEGEEEILAGEGYSYDPESRRDPFKSLLVSTELPELRGPRPEGIPGLLIDEVTVTGVFRTQAGYVAQVQSAANEKSFLLREGDELYDGDVVRISEDEIVFKQIVQDPTALKPFREVVKTLSSNQGR
jgi:Tfp pilus assembly protein PilP